MKNTVLLILLLVFGTAWMSNVNGQCTPADSISCPDPENNGQICPDSLPVAYAGQAYNQSFTIVSPVQVSLFGNTIDVHHLKLKEIGNLPPGISWESNTDDSVFMAGQYYCVLLSGIPSDTGNYPLRIVVGVFVVFNGSPLFLADETDSTSLSLKVEPYNGIDNSFINQNRLSFWPNPFSKDVRMKFTSNEDGTVEIAVYTLQGIPVLRKNAFSVSGANTIFIDGSKLPSGHYVVRVKTRKQTFTGIVSKTD